MVRSSAWLLLLACLTILSNCSIPFNDKKCDVVQRGNQVTEQTIGDVLMKHTKGLLTIPGVVGTGQGLCEGHPCIKVFVVRKTPELNAQIPRNLGGYPVALEETGEIKPLPKK